MNESKFILQCVYFKVSFFLSNYLDFAFRHLFISGFAVFVGLKCLIIDQIRIGVTLLAVGAVILFIFSATLMKHKITQSRSRKIMNYIK